MSNPEEELAALVEEILTPATCPLDEGATSCPHAACWVADEKCQAGQTRSPRRQT